MQYDFLSLGKKCDCHSPHRHLFQIAVFRFNQSEGREDFFGHICQGEKNQPNSFPFPSL